MVRKMVFPLLLAVAVGLGALGGLAAARYVTPLPGPTVAVALPTPYALGAPPPPIPLPPRGAFALDDSVGGQVAALDPASPRPIASIAKTMTALAVLRDHPLGPGAPGPTLTVTPSDVRLLHDVIAADGSHVNVEAGEILSERDLLLGLMLPSANNFAVMLARWSAGTDAAFVAQLNAMAAQMGMSHTHFADADGLDPNTVSTPADLVVLGRSAIADATLREIMSHATATMPDGTVVHNIDTLVGTQPGWLGVKTGHTIAGGYCLLFAMERSVDPALPPVTVVGAILGQAQRADTFSAALASADADVAADVVADPAALPPVTARVHAAWGGDAMAAVAWSNGRARLVRAGTAVTFHVRSRRVAQPAHRGDAVADVVAVIGGVPLDPVPLTLSSDVGSPTWWWRVVR